MSSQIGSLFDAPIVEVERVESEYYEDDLFKIEECPLCGNEHTHGASDLAPRQLTHRATHCFTDHSGGYWLAEVSSE